jgi:carbon-monoxide dehydrogenase large subunit
MIRREDLRLVTGRGQYTADLDADGQAHACFLRADRAHAAIRAIRVEAALRAPGVIGVLTGEDVAAAGLRGLPVNLPFRDKGRRRLVQPHRPALALGRVRHVGEPVALVVAESIQQAQDAAERIEVDYEDLPVVTEVADARRPGAPAIYAEMPDNVCFEYEVGDEARVEQAFATAAHVVTLEVLNNRLVANPLENRAALAWYDTAQGVYSMRLPTQGLANLRAAMAGVLGVEPAQVRLYTGDVGGGFGARTPIYPEHAGLFLAARRFGRPVKWVSTRSETFLAEHHGRDSIMAGALALDRDGRFLGLRVHLHAAMGAYLSNAGAMISTANVAHGLSGVYRLPALYGRMTLLVTNTAPTGPYRGAGRPEMAYFIERIVEEAAVRTGIDRVQLRRQNMIRAFPFRTAAGQVYDSGDFVGALDRALAAADWTGFAARRAAAGRRGALRGIGLSTFLEVTGGMPVEGAAIAFDPNGDVRLYCGTQTNGQGHETVYPLLVAEQLGCPPERVRLIEGDNDLVTIGGTSVGSRSLIAAGTALRLAGDRVIDRAREAAARHFEAGVGDIAFERGRLSVAGTDRAIGLLDLAAALARDLPPGAPHPLDERAEWNVPATFPNGAYVAEIEIDPETGAAALVAFTCVDDNGVVKAPMLVEGQVHGGVAQGAGQALLEHCRYDPATGQLLTGSFLDYSMPRADDLPSFRTAERPTPCTTNPLGAKGAGESGTTGSLAAIVNAVLDALRPLGVTYIDMPVTSEKLWAATTGARK